MPPDRLTREEALFNAAVELPDPAQRAAFLDLACEGDPALRARLEKMLAADDDSFFEKPLPTPRPAEAATLAVSQPPDPGLAVLGERIGHYKLLQKIGEGGCGVVYMAEQEEPVRRRVALKIIKAGMDTRQVIARFEAERQALALMDHPNIAKVLDGGATPATKEGLEVRGERQEARDEGRGERDPGRDIRNQKLASHPSPLTPRPYFVMELVRGVRITDYCDENNLSTRQRLDLFIQVCQAVQHAHQKGIIHRDLKPSNILVTVNDGVPVPKVIDFGIAKATQGRLTDHTLFTAFEQFIGTPAYMSPEQAVMTSLDIDTRSDIYSLGVLLYELLTGTTPFDGRELLKAGLDEMRRIIRETEPAKPSTRLTQLQARTRDSKLAPRPSSLASDLDWIVMKCLEKDRARRYDTPNGLASDIQRFLSNEPIVARPPSAVYKLQKAFRRNKVAFAAAAAVTAALLLGMTASLWQAVRATRAQQEQARLRQEAQTEAAKSRQVADFLKNMVRGMEHHVALGRDTTLLREITERMLADVESDRGLPPEVVLELRSTVGSVFHHLGEYDRAEALHRETLPETRRLLGNDNAQVADLLRDYACVLQHLGRLDEAEAMAREALATSQTLEESGSVAVAESLMTLGVVLFVRGRWVEAEETTRESLAMYRKFLGSENKEVADAMSQHAMLLGKLGRHDEAEPLRREALAMRRKLFGNDHIDVDVSLSDMAEIFAGRGDWAGAVEPLRESLAIRRKLLRDDDPTFGSTLLGLSVALLRSGRAVESEPYAREGLAILQKRLGPDHPHVAQAMNNVAVTLLWQGRMAEAETMYRDILAMLARTESTDTEILQFSLTNLMDALRHQGKSDAALELIGDTLKTAVDPDVRAFLFGKRGDLHARGGRWAEAVADFTQAVDLEPDNRMHHHSLAGLLVWTGDIEGYRNLCRQAVVRFRGIRDPFVAERTAKDTLILPESGVDLEEIAAWTDFAVTEGRDSPALTWFQFAKGLAEYRRGHFAEAIQWAREALREPGPHENLDLQASAVSAMAQYRLDQSDEARATLRRATEVETRLPRLDSGDLGEGWLDGLIARTLLREARSLIEGGSALDSPEAISTPEARP